MAVSLPWPNPSFVSALNGMITGRITMMAAGTIGILFDIILAGGTLTLMMIRNPASLQVERAGLGFVTISILNFTIFDALPAGVLAQFAAPDEAMAPFAGF
jgi:hypothetical protein